MKIAYLLTSLANAGPINVALDLVKVMMAHGHSCKVFYFKEIYGNDFPCETERIHVWSNIRLSDYYVIHSHGLLPDLFMALRRDIGLRCNQRYFTTIHSFIFDDHRYKYGPLKSFFTSRLTLAATSRANKVIVLGKEAIRHFEGHIKSTRMTYAYNTRVVDINESIDSDDVNAISDFAKGRPIIGTVCSINIRKGLEQFVKAMTQVNEAVGVIVGDGAIKPQLELLSQTLGVDDRIMFIGSRKAGYRYLSLFDLFVIPSRSEGFPLALLEAACMKKACVSSDIPVFKEVFTDEELVKFRLDDISDFADKLRYALEEKERLASAIYARYKQDYSPDAFYNRHLAIYTGRD